MRARSFGRLRGAGLSALVLACASGHCLAANLEAVARFVTPAYAAMNVAAVCAAKDSAFLSQTSGPRGTAFHYAEHVKNEAIESLSTAEAAAALRVAADTARDITLQTFRRLGNSDPAVEVRQIRSWCEAEGREVVLKFIREHDDDHPARLMELKERQR